MLQAILQLACSYKKKLTVIKDYGKQDFKQHGPLESNLGISIVFISDKWSQESTTWPMRPIISLTNNWETIILSPN